MSEEQRRRRREGDREPQRERMRNATEEQRQAEQNQKRERRRNSKLTAEQKRQREVRRTVLKNNADRKTLTENCKHIGYSFLDFYEFVIGSNFVSPNNLSLRFCILFYR